MKKRFFLIAVIGSIAHAAADDIDQRIIDAPQRIASAHQRFLVSWKEDMYDTAIKRAAAFQSTTYLAAKICYYGVPQNSVTLPASPFRLGLTGLLLGKDAIPCFVAHPDDPIPELVKPAKYLGVCQWQEKWPQTFYPTIWHFLASEGGQKIIEEYRSLDPSR